MHIYHDDKPAHGWTRWQPPFHVAATGAGPRRVTSEKRIAMKAESVRAGPGGAAGVTEPMIVEVVHAFYGRVRRDPTLGPVFARVIGDDWDAHLSKMCDFWSSVLLMSGRFHGTPMVAHIRLEDVGPQHFAHWLRIFRDTVTEICPADAAALFVAKSKMIARSLQFGIASHRGEPPLATAIHSAPQVQDRE